MKVNKVDSVLDQVRGALERGGPDSQPLVERGEILIVGVSGGPDSLCLLHLLCRLRGHFDALLHIGHLHHGIRGGDADADAAYVESLATEWGLGCTVERADVLALARRRGLALEEAARGARYAFLCSLAEQKGARTIAVAHNADDQAETVLMHLLRGTGLAGMRGMLPLTPLDDRLFDREAFGRVMEPRRACDGQPSGLRLIRPLLEVSRAEIEAYCAAQGLAPRQDPSNLDQTYFRNWLRHAVLPLLAQHNPNVRDVLRRTARVAADDYALLRTLLDGTWSDVVREESADRIAVDLEAWRALPTSLQRSILREAIHRLRRSLRDISFHHVEDALQVARSGTTGALATLPQGLMLRLDYRLLHVEAAQAGRPLPDWPLLSESAGEVPVHSAGVTVLDGSEWVLQARRLAACELPAGWRDNSDPWQAFLDAERLGSAPVLRSRRAGDRFRPMGMHGRWTGLADYLTNRKVPRAARDRLPLLVAGAEIAWVCGYHLSEGFCVRESTTHILHLRFVKNGDSTGNRCNPAGR